MMSDEEFDEESYIAYENELYGEKSSDSEEEIDSEVEEALYSQLHYSFSLPNEEELDKQNNDDHDDEDDNSGNDDDVLDSDSSEDNQELYIANQEDDKELQDDLNKDEDSTEKIDCIIIDEESGSNSGNSDGDNNEEGKSDDDDDDDDIAYTSSKATVSVQEDWSLIEEDLQSNLLADGKRRSSSRYYKKNANFRCRNCNERGHKAVDCPTPKKISCFLCGGEHMRKWCPNELCFNCHEPGHRLMNCRKPRSRPDDQCHRCFMLGHFYKDCPDRWRQYHRTTEAKKQPVANRTGEFMGPVYCYNCSEQGHYGHECLEDRMDFHVSPACPFVVKYDGDPQSPQHNRIREDNQRKRTQTHDGTIGCSRERTIEKPSKRQRQNERQSWPKQHHDESRRKTGTVDGIDDGGDSYAIDGRVGQFIERISERTKKRERGKQNRKSWTTGQSRDHEQSSRTQQGTDDEIIIIDGPIPHNPKGSMPGNFRKDNEGRIGSKRRHSETHYHDESKKGKTAENRVNEQKKKKNKGKLSQSAFHDERTVEIVHDDEIQAYDDEYQSKQGGKNKNKKFTKPRGQVDHHHYSPAFDHHQSHSSPGYDSRQPHSSLTFDRRQPHSSSTFDRRQPRSSSTFDCRQPRSSSTFERRQPRSSSTFDCRQPRSSSTFDRRQVRSSPGYDRRQAHSSPGYDSHQSHLSSTFDRRQSHSSSTYDRRQSHSSPAYNSRQSHFSPSSDHRQLHWLAAFGRRQSGSSHPHNKRFSNQRSSLEYNGTLFITSRGFQSKRK